VGGENQVELVGRQQLDRRPAGEDDQQRGDAADEQPEDAGDGVPAHQLLGLVLELQSGDGTGTVGRCHLFFPPYFT
jgi:hypothetical protein